MKIELRIQLILVVSLFFLAGCKESLSCQKNLQNITMRNSNSIYNCGNEYLTLRDKGDLSKICMEFDSMEKAYFLLTNYNSGYVDIAINYKNNTFSSEMITLIFTINNGYVFRMQDGMKYKNDRLAEYVIDLLEIKEVYSDVLCDK